MAKFKSFSLNRFLLQFTLLAILLFFVALIALSLGSININISDLITILSTQSEETQLSQIVYQIRLPRIIYAMIIGGGLSIAGAVFQAILINPLAEPYILGISSGGTFGAVLSFLLGFTFASTQIFAFVGALLVMLIVFLLGKRYGDLEPNTLLLSGVMVGAFFSAAILLLVIFLNDSLRTAVYWMIGSLTFAKLENLHFVVITTVLVSVYLVYNSHKYNILSLGEETSATLGINTSFLKISTYIVSSLMIAALVSVSGIIGFVGLIVPHVCRMVFGADNRNVIPFSFLVGAIYLTIADTIARTIISPFELPVGSITAIIGAPVFIYLLRTRFSLK